MLRGQGMRKAMMIAGALATVAAAGFGLHIATRLGRLLMARGGCPAPAAPLPLPPPPPPPPVTERGIGVMQVRDDAVEIEVGGARRQLAGYPRPLSRQHQPPRLTTAVVSPDGRQVAIAGICYGSSGSDPRVPTCARAFVRLYRAADGALVRDLPLPWQREIDDERRVLAMAFDDRAALLAVLVGGRWSDCSYDGASTELVVYRLDDGARVAHRILAREDVSAGAGIPSLTVAPEAVRVRVAFAHAARKVWDVRLTRPR
jgi:hypothetical protein